MNKDDAITLACRIFFVVLVVCSFGYLTSAIDLGGVPQNQCVELIQPCANCTNSNLSSVIYPNGSFSLLGSYTMTQNNSLFNYSYCGTAGIGTYKYTTSYDLNGVNTISDPPHSFTVTPSGEISSTGTALLYTALLTILALFFVAIVIYGLNTDNLVGKTFSIGFGYLLIMAIFFVGWQLAFNFIYSSPFLVSFLRIGFIVLVAGFFPLLIILFAYGVYMMLQLKEIRSMQERGISIDEINERKFGAAGRY